MAKSRINTDMSWKCQACGMTSRKEPHRRLQDHMEVVHGMIWSDILDRYVDVASKALTPSLDELHAEFMDHLRELTDFARVVSFLAGDELICFISITDRDEVQQDAAVRMGPLEMRHNANQLRKLARKISDEWLAIYIEKVELGL